MYPEQPGAQCCEDSGDGCRLQEEPSPTYPHHPEWLPSRHCRVLPLLNFPSGINKVLSHLISSLLGTIISQNLKWELNISSITKKAQQRMFFLRQLKKFNLPKTMMVHFYTSIIESILTSSITLGARWHSA